MKTKKSGAVPPRLGFQMTNPQSLCPASPWGKSVRELGHAGWCPKLSFPVAFSYTFLAPPDSGAPHCPQPLIPSPLCLHLHLAWSPTPAYSFPTDLQVPQPHFRNHMYLLCAQPCPTLCSSPMDIARQAPLSMEFSSKNTRAGCHFLRQGIFRTSGSNPALLGSCIGTVSLPLVQPGKPRNQVDFLNI